MQSYAAVLSHSEHLVVVCKHASWLRMQKLGLGRHGGAAVRVERRDEKVSEKNKFFVFIFRLPNNVHCVDGQPDDGGTFCTHSRWTLLALRMRRCNAHTMQILLRMCNESLHVFQIEKCLLCSTSEMT